MQTEPESMWFLYSIDSVTGLESVARVNIDSVTHVEYVVWTHKYIHRLQTTT